MQRHDGVDEAGLNGFGGHAEDDAGGFILGDGEGSRRGLSRRRPWVPSLPMPVWSDGGDGAAGKMQGGGAEQIIDGGAAVVFRAGSAVIWIWISPCGAGASFMCLPPGAM